MRYRIGQAVWAQTKVAEHPGVVVDTAPLESGADYEVELTQNGRTYSAPAMENELRPRSVDTTFKLLQKSSF